MGADLPKLSKPAPLRVAPHVSERQAQVLRYARDAGSIKEADGAGRGMPHVFKSCRHHRWLAPRGDGPTAHYIITDGGLAALAYYDADVAMEKLWKGGRG